MTTQSTKKGIIINKNMLNGTLFNQTVEIYKIDGTAVHFTYFEKFNGGEQKQACCLNIEIKILPETNMTNLENSIKALLLKK